MARSCELLKKQQRRVSQPMLPAMARLERRQPKVASLAQKSHRPIRMSTGKGGDGKSERRDVHLENEDDRVCSKPNGKGDAWRRVTRTSISWRQGRDEKTDIGSIASTNSDSSADSGQEDNRTKSSGSEMPSKSGDNGDASNSGSSTKGGDKRTWQIASPDEWQPVGTMVEQRTVEDETNQSSGDSGSKSGSPSDQRRRRVRGLW